VFEVFKVFTPPVFIDRKREHFYDTSDTSFKSDRSNGYLPNNARRNLAVESRAYAYSAKVACALPILKLRWQSVDLPGRVIRIEASNTKTLKTRLVPVTERLRQSLARLERKAFRKMSRVFPIGDFKHSWAGACREANLENLHFHDLRHTAITRMLERGISPAIVMKISGHTQQRTFLRYVNQTESSIRDIARALDRAA